MNDQIILSLTTHANRWKYFNAALQALIHQSVYSMVHKFIINIDDDSPKSFIDQIHTITSIDDKLSVNVCDKKWRSANKLIPTYKRFHDNIIVCFDDDKNYPINCLEQLLNAYQKHSNCIIAQEINPIVIDNTGKLMYINGMDIKLEQEEFGKYLSNACLFPPNCFSDELYNYENFVNVTNCKHDELWFWIISTLNGIKCVGLNNTYTYEYDGVTFTLDDSSLTHINSLPNEIAKYNNAINKYYGKSLMNIIDNNWCIFKLNKDNILAFTGNIMTINRLYNRFNIKIICDHTIVNSWKIFLIKHISAYEWHRKLEIQSN